MNSKQRSIMVIAIIVIAVMGLYPPFYFRTYTGAIINLGYGSVLDPPKIDTYAGSVNVQLLLVQWLGVIVIAAIAVLLTKTRSK